MSKELQKIDKPTNTSTVRTKLDLSNINSAALSASLGQLSIPRLFYQLVVFVLDGSGSMSFPGISGKSKGKEIDDAIKKVLRRLLASKNSNSFDISVWAYANESKQMSAIQPLVDMDLSKSINPCEYIDQYNGTNLISTIKSVQNECEIYLNSKKDKNAQALVLILSDGALDNLEESISSIDKLKQVQNLTISSIFYESKKWQENYKVRSLELLKRDMETIASSKAFYTSSLDPDEIRKHMIKSISTVSKID